jgi:hypothetical protein
MPIIVNTRNFDEQTIEEDTRGNIGGLIFFPLAFRMTSTVMES